MKAKNIVKVLSEDSSLREEVFRQLGRQNIIVGDIDIFYNLSSLFDPLIIFYSFSESGLKITLKFKELYSKLEVESDFRFTDYSGINSPNFVEITIPNENISYSRIKFKIILKINTLLDNLSYRHFSLFEKSKLFNKLRQICENE